ncbi:MAG TPA: ATP-binding cassette domain-containing protein [Candidatus Angelobacter sp.]|nr:ATP-binding cassette domain-containing protein [Candidatus Angelobacter sp.]
MQPVIQMVGVAVGNASETGTVSIEGVDWSISTGDYWVVGGPPGSGKSDLLATMAGLYRPLRGTLRLFGSDTADLAEDHFLAARMRIGLVFENGGRLFNHLTLAENIALPIRYHHGRCAINTKERVEEILDATDLAQFANCTPGQIKHAWRQRAGLARAMAMHPDVLLLDNPLAGLGPQESRWWREFLVSLPGGNAVTRGQPVALVVACHDLRPWTDQGKQFALLKQKRWLSVGGRAELGCCDEPLLRELLAADFAMG